MTAPQRLPRQLWAALCVIVVLSGVLANVLTPQPLVLSRTSYGGPPWAWGAVYDLFNELHLRPTRSRLPLAERDTARTQWLIEPAWTEAEMRYQVSEVERFAAAGGTVVVFGAAMQVWKLLGFAVHAQPQEDAKVDDAARTPGTHTATQETETLVMVGSWLPRARKLEVAEHASLFDSKSGAGNSARVSTTHGAFVLERTVGKGKLVAVADSAFLTNDALARGDDAAFAVDLVRAYGAPCFDEYCHGLVQAHSPWAVLGASFLLLAALTLGALSLASIAHARLWPLPTVADEAPPAPTLEVFTASLANLYRSRGSLDPPAAFRAYRAGYLRRLQRAWSPHSDGSQARFLERLFGDANRLGLDGTWLEPDARPRTTAELVRAVAELERLGQDFVRRKNTP